MKSLRKNIVLMFVVSIFAINQFYAHLCCDSADAGDLESVKEEVWELHLTGDWEAKFEILCKKASPEEGVFVLSGKFSGSVEDSQWGNLDIRLKIEGEDDRSSFIAVLSGDVTGTESAASTYRGSVKGKLKGTLSHSQGSGTYGIIHNLGAPSGEWTLKKIR